MIMATVIIMSVSFLLIFVPSKAFGMIWMIVDLILCKKNKFFRPAFEFHFSAGT
jgi:hypothetical protein